MHSAGVKEAGLITQVTARMTSANKRVDRAGRQVSRGEEESMRTSGGGVEKAGMRR